MEAFCQRLPKVELHAHLNGSISAQTLKHLIQRKGKESLSKIDIDALVRDSNNLEEVFQLFQLIYQVVDDIDAVRFLTRSVIHEFAQDNVRYLELRTTLRPKELSGFEKEDYLLAVLEEMEKSQRELPNITVRLIVSIDRRTCLEDALKTVELALKYKESGIVGIDLCGDPTKGSWTTIKPALEKARDYGFKITLHLGEVQNFEESKDMLLFKPDRIGHATYLDEELKSLVALHRIPLELCQTSNLKSQTVKAPSEHQLKYWHFQKHPFSICTDDKGVFACTSSGEYSLAASTFELSTEDLFSLSYQAIDQIFEGEAVKQKLRQLWQVERALL